MKQNSCTICGGTDKALIDGYYYCVECGTQDVNAQETVVEQTVLADNTYATVSRKKLKVLSNAIEMSGEWHKWHTYNFILMGLADEVVAAGASPTFRKKVLWIWQRYMKKYINKDEMGQAAKGSEDIETDKLFLQDDDIEMDDHKVENDEECFPNSRIVIGRVSKVNLLSIIYLALNYDRSDIQLSHLLRFVREGKISLFYYRKHIPVEMNLKSIGHEWSSFMRPNFDYSPITIRERAMRLVRALDLGPPLVPDLRKMVEYYVKELCLPRDFQKLVLSLIKEIPCNYLQVPIEAINKFKRVPDYEGKVMCYIMVALKMCFGLDDDYEIKLSNAIDDINIKEGRMRSYKIGRNSNPSDRLFSFREWSNYLQLRKAILCKFYLPMAQHNKMVVDDHIFLGQLVDRLLQPMTHDLGEEVIMDLISKIPLNDDSPFIPTSEFVATLTPMTDYTEIVVEYLQDTELKLLLSEDFSQYSLRHACIDLKLFSVNGEEISLPGITDQNKIINKNIVIESEKLDVSTVFVRNCDNKNWLKTNQPTLEHFIEIKGCENNNSDNEKDLEYDSNSETVNMDDTRDDVTAKKKLETIDEEAEGVCIFDDDFTNIDDDGDKRDNNSSLNNEVYNTFDFKNIEGNNGESFHELNDISDSEGETKFDPAAFNRSNTIQKLIMSACKRYKIPIPNEYKEREPKKRTKGIQDEAGSSRRKRIRVDKPTKYGNDKTEFNEILAAYYSNLENDFLSKVSMQVQSFVHNFDENYRLFNATNSTNMCDSYDVEENVNNNERDVNEDEIICLSDSDVIGDKEQEQTIDDLLPKIDPRFDENTHDIKQLYVKFSKQFNFNDLLDDIYPEIDKIIENTMERSKSNMTETNALGKDSLYDSEDDLPLENIAKKLEVLRAKKRQKKLKLPCLVEDQEYLTNFNYWFRHHRQQLLKSVNRIELFDKELKDNYSKSFNLFIVECSSLIYQPPYFIFKSLQSLETKIAYFLKKRSKTHK